jgi:ribosomal protein L19E
MNPAKLRAAARCCLDEADRAIGDAAIRRLLARALEFVIMAETIEMQRDRRVRPATEPAATGRRDTPEASGRIPGTTGARTRSAKVLAIRAGRTATPAQ